VTDTNNPAFDNPSAIPAC